jgi:phage terminase large subunit-like protein
VIEYEQVVEHLKGETKGMTISTIAFDRWRIDLFKKAAETLGGFGEFAEWKPVGQGFKDMSPRLEFYEQQLLNGLVAHGAHPLLNLAVASAIAVFDPVKNRKLEKVKSSARIDALVAAVMSAGCLADFDEGLSASSLVIL